MEVLGDHKDFFDAETEFHSGRRTVLSRNRLNIPYQNICFPRSKSDSCVAFRLRKFAQARADKKSRHRVEIGDGFLGVGL